MCTSIRVVWFFSGEPLTPLSDAVLTRNVMDVASHTYTRLYWHT